ncbi:MAG: ester cyclase [Planctomycetota bacterium]
MTESEQNKALVRRYYQQVVNTGDVAAIADFVAADYTEVHAGVRYPLGVEGARDHVLGVRRTYPDLHLTIHRQIAEGEWVATQATMRGTQAGEWMGIAPTGKTIEVAVVNVDRVVDGRIVEHGGAADLLTPLFAIGAVRPGGGSNSDSV